MQGFLAILLVILLILVGISIGILMVTIDKLEREVDMLRLYSYDSRLEAHRLNNRVAQLNAYKEYLQDALLVIVAVLVIGLVIGIATVIGIVIIVAAIYFAGKKIIEYGGETLTLKVLDKHKEMEEKRNEEGDKYSIM